jgi:hypothetical protein
VPEVAGILTADRVLATGRSIAAVQQADGAIGWPDGHVDAWNHVECAMALSACGLRDAARRGYEWQRAAQYADGSWPKRWADGSVTDLTAESNHAAYPAVGVWHEVCLSQDEEFAALLWPVVRAGIEFALGLQVPRGEIIWRRGETGAPDDYALLTGCSSRYYPVLGGPVRDAAARQRLERDWDSFVVAGLGVRCVSDQPWVTGAETCELALALDAIGDRGRALEQFEQIQHLRDPSGAYWTGWQFMNQAHFPREQSSWTAAAVILAADALSGATGASGIFRDCAAGGAVTMPADGAACGCDPRA